MTAIAFARRIRTLQMLARTATSAHQAAIYQARVELAWQHVRRAGRNSRVVSYR